MPPSPLVCDLGGGLPAQFRVWPNHALALPPLLQFSAGLLHRGEQRFVEAFIAQPAVGAEGGRSPTSPRRHSA